MYNLTLKTPPAVEPIQIGEIKSYLKIDFDYDDDYIDSLITTAREWCEDYQRRAYITQVWQMSLDDWPSDVIDIPKGNLQSIDLIKYKDYRGIERTLTNEVDYVYSKQGIVGRITTPYGKPWPIFVPYPLDAITIEFTCGYGNDGSKIPKKVIQAMYLLISHWYENRTPLSDTRTLPDELKFSVTALLHMDRIPLL